MAENKEELKSLLIQKTKIMAVGPITLWRIEGETVETVADFILGGSKITADGDCSHEIKKHLFPGRKVMTNLDSILESRDYFADKGLSSQGYGFSSIIYGCDSWTIKKAECQRIDAFGTVVLEKTLESPFNFKEIQQVHPKGDQSWVFSGRTDLL